MPTADAFWQDLQQRNYRVLSQGSFPGTEDFTYSAYGLIDHTLEPAWDKDHLTTEACRLVFYRWDGQRNLFLGTFPAPQFPAGSRYHGFPVLCEVVHWENSAHFSVADENKQALRATAYSSDINHNGWPEFAVWAWYCPNACDGNEGTLFFYEIQTDTVQPLTDNLPGIIYPWDIVHSANPLTIQVYDVRHEYEPHLEIETAWLYQWQGGQFRDVSAQYAEEYALQIETLAAAVRQNFGQAFEVERSNELKVLKILFLAEKAGLSEAGLATFLELTDPAHWPDTMPLHLCWLQLARAMEQTRFAQHQPFALPFSSSYFELGGSPEWQAFDATTYDLSACQNFPP